MKWYFLSIIFMITGFLPAFSQINDTIPLSFSEFISAVAEKHPLAKIARMEPEFAERNMQFARGAFDPILFADYDEKFFDSKNYFKQFSAGIAVPTWLGITAKAGYDRNTGIFLNPEKVVPSQGLHYLGLSVPLGQNLFIDTRRAGIRQARINISVAGNQEFILLNTALVQAAEAFWEWNNAWEKYNVYEEVFNLAQERYDFTVRSYLLGDKAAIDTVEAFSVYNVRRNQLLQMKLEFQNQGFQLNNYLWIEDVPVERSIPVHPSYNAFDHDTALSAETLAGNHPEINNYLLKLDALDLERRLKTEKLKPKLNVNYNLLSRPFYGNGNGSAVLSTNDYKWGFEFAIPVFLREGRADLQMTRLKIQQQQLVLDQKKAELINKIDIVLNLLNNLKAQIRLQQETVSAMQTLLTGERTLYLSGESSLFLLNSREASYLDASMKLIDLKTKYFIYYYQLQYLKGEPVLLNMP